MRQMYGTEPTGQSSYRPPGHFPQGYPSSCSPPAQHQERLSHGWGCRAQQGGPDGSPASRVSLEERCPAPNPSVLPDPPGVSHPVGSSVVSSS